MSEPTLDVLAIGNAIVDILGRCDDALLAKHGAPKGHMRLVDGRTVDDLRAELTNPVEISGGSAANTVVGVASFGGKAGFIGKVANDDLGAVFTRDIRAAGVSFHSSPANSKQPTARSLILVTPDGQRTMNTCLGISPELGAAELDDQMIRSARVVYLEGYLYDQPAAMAAFKHAATVAKAAGREVALTLSDGFCVDRHRAEFLELIKTSVSILFANEAEITSLYQTASFDEAVARVRRDAKLAVVTRSEKGATLVHGSDPVIHVDAAAVAQVVDTTGAGDLYAAGFLYGYTRGLGLETAGRLGSLAAAEVISHLGARPAQPLAALARAKGLQ